LYSLFNFLFSALTDNIGYFHNKIFNIDKCNITIRYVMAVNQSQVDHIITAASEDDPEVKLQNLEREVDLIKTSIKRLLIDIRERMNEMENPFTLAATGIPAGPSAAVMETDEAQKSAMEAREAALEARETRLEAAKAKLEYDTTSGKLPVISEPVRPSSEVNKHSIDEQMLAVLRSQAGTPQKATYVTPAPVAGTNEKLHLQKVYKLFKWTQQAVKKIGHDRLEIILESYRVMGYITKESCDEIREISRLMPANLGEEHEVGPDEFVSDLYALNRILSPNDTSLDRDMIEVMMEQRQNIPDIPSRSGEERIDLPRVTIIQKKSSMAREKDDEWMNLPDRI
jgi:GTP:adenosylcobinamide-phosphate guanylyltransferase